MQRESCQLERADAAALPVGAKPSLGIAAASAAKAREPLRGAGARRIQAQGGPAPQNMFLRREGEEEESQGLVVAMARKVMVDTLPMQVLQKMAVPAKDTAGPEE